MDFITSTVHPLGGFDLTAIGIVLVAVMAILLWPRAFPPKRKPEDHE